MIQVIPLGAGQEVGRSCVLATICNKNIMFDCGMHMGYNDDRRFPDFSYLSQSGNFDRVLDCVLITHFHLDHCGALPYFTEICGYNGPIYMTPPTKAIAPLLLEDCRKIIIDKKGGTIYSNEDIKNCLKRVKTININESIYLSDDFEIKAYYAGHVLGAVMFYVRYKLESIVYTGDYNMTPDRHLGAASIDKLNPDLLITETTYATTLRDSRRSRERDFLKKVHDCVERGGKVLIPLFALGRAQEMSILIDSYWERLNLKVPIYFSAGLTKRANNYYRLYINWTSQQIKETFSKRNMFEYKHIKPFERQFADEDGPMVVFAAPGMLHFGMSLEIFKKWAPDPKNMVIIPGYCVAGTVGAKILAGAEYLELDKGIKTPIKIQIELLSFSAHADAKGIMQLIVQCEPKNVMLVHGDKSKMKVLKSKIADELKIPCYDPPNGSIIEIETHPPIPINISMNLVSKVIEENCNNTIKDLLKTLPEDEDAISVKEYKKRLLLGLETLHDSISFNGKLTIDDQIWLDLD